MSDDRHRALSSLKNTNLEIIFINRDNLSSWILKNYPLHPSYKYLSSVHKADYLRCYFMHNYGGAYSDIKVLADSWLLSYEELHNSEYLINGYKEINCMETAKGRGLIKDVWLALNFYKIIGNGAYICKPNTAFTGEWIDKVHQILDQKYELLVNHPARDHRDFYHKELNGGIDSEYPLRWAEICGEIFHPLCLKYSKKILKSLPTPDFSLKYL
tara:strand:- start:322 stop:963 length:642 start_codon:yes stop_codon:yes gene_type:complete